MKGSRQESEEWNPASRDADAATEDAETQEEGEAIAPEYRRRRRPLRVRRTRTADWARAARRRWKPVLAGGIALAVGAGIYSLLFRSAWFVLAGSDQITVAGTHQADPANILNVFSSDLGRNLFFIPLEARRQSIQAISWVRSAEVLRLWPARLEVRIQERTPVAFARISEKGTPTDQLRMLDASGVLLDRPTSGNFDFVVLTGLAGIDAADPNASHWLAQRQPQMQLYAALRADLDRDGSHHSQDFSEIDLSDASDVRARVSGAGGTTTLIHLGSHNFAARYALYLSQINDWRQKYPGLVSVDLRYDGQAIVDPGASTPAVSKAAVKPGPGGQKPHSPRPQ